LVIEKTGSRRQKLRGLNGMFLRSVEARLKKPRGEVADPAFAADAHDTTVDVVS
jgi:hypothetical protein